MNFEILDSTKCTEEDVARLESELGVSLSNDFREFLKEFGGGFCKYSGIFLDNYWQAVSYFEPISRKELIEGVRIVQDGKIPEEFHPSVVIGRDPRRQICLCCSDEHFGAVFFNDFQYEEYSLATNTFAEFISGIKPLPADEADYWTQAEMEPWSFCQVDDRESVVNSLDRGFSIDAVDSDSDRPLTMLAIAAASGRRTLVKQLLDAKADPNCVGYEGFSSMHLSALVSQSKEILELLFVAGGDVNLANEAGDTPIVLCARSRGSTSVFKWLLSKGADPMVKNSVSESAMSILKRMESKNDYEWDWKPKLDAIKSLKK